MTVLKISTRLIGHQNVTWRRKSLKKPRMNSRRITERTPKKILEGVYGKISPAITGDISPATAGEVSQRISRKKALKNAK